MKFPVPKVKEERGCYGEGDSGWRFQWQAGASVCNSYPKWHLQLCEDGGMSVEECGRECVHVTPTDWAALSAEPNQRKDLEAASIASHHQAVFGLHGPEAFGWSASSCSASTPAPAHTPAPAPAPSTTRESDAGPAPRDQGLPRWGRGEGGMEGGGQGSEQAGGQDSRRQASTAGSRASDAVARGRSPGTAEEEDGLELGGGGWDAWWEESEGKEEAGGGEEADLWRGSHTSAAGGAVRARTRLPRASRLCASA